MPCNVNDFVSYQDSPFKVTTVNDDAIVITHVNNPNNKVVFSHSDWKEQLGTAEIVRFASSSTSSHRNVMLSERQQQDIANKLPFALAFNKQGVTDADRLIDSICASDPSIQKRPSRAAAYRYADKYRKSGYDKLSLLHGLAFKNLMRSI